MSARSDDRGAAEREQAARLKGARVGQPRHHGDGLSVTLMLCYLVATLMLVLMAVISTELQDRFGLSASQIGLLTSAFMFTYGAMGIPAGSAAARWGGRVLMFSSALTVVGSLVFGLSSSYAGFLVGRILQGLGGGMVLPVSSPVIARALVPDKRDRGWGIFAGGKGLGVLVGLLAMPGVSALGGFRAVFLVTAGLAVIAGGIAIAQGPVRELPDASSATASFRGQGRMLGATLVNHRVWLLGLFNAASIAIGTAVMVWTPDFLVTRHGASVGVAAYLTAGLAVAQLVGAPVGAAGAVRLGRMAVITGSMFAMSAAAVLIPVMPGRVLVFIMVVLVGFFSFAYFSPRFAMIPEVVGRPEHVGPATGFGNLLGYGISTLAPWLFGVVLDRGLGYFAAYLVLAIFGMAGVVGSFFMRVSNKPERERIRRSA